MSLENGNRFRDRDTRGITKIEAHGAKLKGAGAATAPTTAPGKVFWPNSTALDPCRRPAAALSDRRLTVLDRVATPPLYPRVLAKVRGLQAQDRAAGRSSSVG